MRGFDEIEYDKLRLSTVWQVMSQYSMTGYVSVQYDRLCLSTVGQVMSQYSMIGFEKYSMIIYDSILYNS